MLLRNVIRKNWLQSVRQQRGVERGRLHMPWYPPQRALQAGLRRTAPSTELEQGREVGRRFHSIKPEPVASSPAKRDTKAVHITYTRASAEPPRDADPPNGKNDNDKNDEKKRRARRKRSKNIFTTIAALLGLSTLGDQLQRTQSRDVEKDWRIVHLFLRRSREIKDKELADLRDKIKKKKEKLEEKKLEKPVEEIGVLVEEIERLEGEEKLVQDKPFLCTVRDETRKHVEAQRSLEQMANERFARLHKVSKDKDVDKVEATRKELEKIKDAHKEMARPSISSGKVWAHYKYEPLARQHLLHLVLNLLPYFCGLPPKYQLGPEGHMMRYLNGVFAMRAGLLLGHVEESWQNPEDAKKKAQADLYAQYDLFRVEYSGLKQSGNTDIFLTDSELAGLLEIADDEHKERFAEFKKRDFNRPWWRR